MSCNSSGCQSNCYKNGDQVSDSPPPPPPLAAANDSNNLCLKCKTNSPITPGSLSGDEARFCADCFRSNIYGKFRLAVTSHAMISPSDNVLVAFSGGPSSRVALQFVHGLQDRAQKNFEASKDKSLPVFGVGVAFIDESAVYPVSSDKVDGAIQDMRSVVSNLAPPAKQLHVVPIENIYASDSIDGKDRLTKLLDAVNDATGKEDLLLHLRMLALQKVASQNGYNRLILGSCTSRIACHVLAATVKGQGYSLSADIQYVDARWEIPVVLPLRDCTSQELNLLCHLDGLKTLQPFDRPPSGINGLISSFVNVLQEENSSRECTILRTAGKLTPFEFNRIPETDDCNVPLAIRRRQKRSNLKTNESIFSELFCPICNGPLKNFNSLNLSSLKSCQSSRFNAACCSSCQFQIIPKDPSSMENFCSLLPQQVVDRAKHGNCSNSSLLREQIQDCLLLDSGDET
ncbi:PREDICTED: cytoplasmic tRNA 2-thiolation protein 2 [Populus euphratica]|uniref:Cytoplasmic tRNA 2-thiolation protein 2 n=1 Tax=Populus euphratica TaxID=75702 RepID=A0AAJ6VIA2_POPEU|nr:PREDICTED: cytoplasmic tRNA 2-thiolation protein 2 [Populus euphratica]